MRRKVKGSFTIEAAVIVPLILFVFVVLLNILFYYHDKNILMATAHETLSLGASRKDLEEGELERHFSSRIQQKLMLFSRVTHDVQIGSSTVSITCAAKTKTMRLDVEYVLNRNQPEDYIREIRKLQKIGEEIGEKE